MDPDETLKQARQALNLAEQATDLRLKGRLLAESLRHYRELDLWIARGGLLPADWEQ